MCNGCADRIWQHVTGGMSSRLSSLGSVTRSVVSFRWEKKTEPGAADPRPELFQPGAVAVDMPDAEGKLDLL